MIGNAFDNNSYKQPISKRTLTWVVALIVIACVLLLVTIAILCVVLPNSHINIFSN
jgi:type IV secretory pathway component VirB8